MHVALADFAKADTVSNKLEVPKKNFQADAHVAKVDVAQAGCGRKFTYTLMIN